MGVFNGNEAVIGGSIYIAIESCDFCNGCAFKNGDSNCRKCACSYLTRPDKRTVIWKKKSNKRQTTEKAEPRTEHVFEGKWNSIFMKTERGAMLYKTISDSSIVSFEEKVQRSLSEGWVLHGDLFVHRDMFNQTVLFRPSIFKKKIKTYDVVIGATPVDLDNWVRIFIDHGRKPYGSVVKDMEGNLAQVLIK